MEFDYVVTLCDNANEACSFFPAKTKVLHSGFDDPPRLAEGLRNEEEALNHYRRARDEIKAFIDDPQNQLNMKGDDGSKTTYDGSNDTTHLRRYSL